MNDLGVSARGALCALLCCILPLLPVSRLHGETPPLQTEKTQMPPSSAPPLQQASPTPNTAVPNSHHQQHTQTAQGQRPQGSLPVLPNPSAGYPQPSQQRRPSESAVHPDASAPAQVPRAEQSGAGGQVNFNF